MPRRIKELIKNQLGKFIKVQDIGDNVILLKDEFGEVFEVQIVNNIDPGAWDES